jgi:sulfur carrier protein ThiS
VVEMVKVKLEGEVKNVKASGTIKDLMGFLSITPEEYLSVLNGEVVTEHEPFSSRDTVKFVRVWSGG